MSYEKFEFVSENENEENDSDSELSEPKLPEEVEDPIPEPEVKEVETSVKVEEDEEVEEVQEVPVQVPVPGEVNDFGNFVNNILHPNPNDIISNLFGGLLKTLLQSVKPKEKVSESEEKDDDDDEEEDEEDEDEGEDEEEEEDDEDEEEEEKDEEENGEGEEETESEESQEIYLIFENKKRYFYATSYSNAQKTMSKLFQRFLYKNNTQFMRIDKDLEKIVVYNREPNSLQPFNEQLLYEIEFFTVEKY